MKNMGKTRSEIVLMYKTFMKIKPQKKMSVCISVWRLVVHTAE